MHAFTNELVHETSPYLLQHAHNPVNWFPWSETALQKARAENKPILVSIGYSACHWCHVMERESFEDEATAAIMNEHFINIKIDREERPDLDHIYMDAVQAIAGSGGWPLNVFLTPDAKPFYGGTYFPPQRAFNRPSWKETLQSVTQAFNEKRNEIDAQAENLTAHLLKANSFGMQQLPGDEVFASENFEKIAQNIMQAADREWGGFGKAPKFPQTASIQFLLRYARFAEAVKNEIETNALQQALLSLDKMIEGGIYDQAGGGFARYSTDTEWLAPHFEKMLYDNALLVSVLSEAYQLTSKARYKEVIDETLAFVERELCLVNEKGQKAFYAALDADSEGVEGKFYVWSLAEVQNLLGKDSDAFCAYYDITEKGNWEHTNILRVKKDIHVVAAELKMNVDELEKILSRGRKLLLEKRAERIRPGLDDKIILGWNALMNTAYCKAFAATGNKSYRDTAVGNMKFLLENFSADIDSSFHHTWKNGQAKYPAFLDDYAYLIEALLCLQEITADRSWLVKAEKITRFVTEHFSEAETGFFFYTPSFQKDIIVRKKEVYDGATPSGNSVMAINLHRLAILMDEPEWNERSSSMVRSLGNAIVKYPTSFGIWACLLQEIVEGTDEIAILEPAGGHLQDDLLRMYLPHKVLMAANEPDNAFPLLAEKLTGISGAIYLCRNYTCQKPVFSAKELIPLINRGAKR